MSELNLKIIDRPEQILWSRSRYADLITAMAQTAETGKAIEITINGGAPTSEITTKLRDAIQYAMRKLNYHSHIRIDRATGKVIAWAEKRE